MGFDNEAEKVEDPAVTDWTKLHCPVKLNHSFIRQRRIERTGLTTVCRRPLVLVDWTVELCLAWLVLTLEYPSGAPSAQVLRS